MGLVVPVGGEPALTIKAKLGGKSRSQKASRTVRVMAEPVCPPQKEDEPKALDGPKLPPPPDPKPPTPPEEPTLKAPPVDPSVATTVYDSTKFLYEGDDPVQEGVDEGTIEPKRAAVMRAKILIEGARAAVRFASGRR